MAALRTYYIERPLTAEEVAEVEEALAREVEQVRIPYLAPAPNFDRSLVDDITAGSASLGPVLESVGIRADIGTQVALVVPKDRELHALLCEALHEATGFLPYIVQTTEQREAVGNPGHLRVTNMHGLMPGL